MNAMAAIVFIGFVWGCTAMNLLHSYESSKEPAPIEQVLPAPGGTVSDGDTAANVKE